MDVDKSLDDIIKQKKAKIGKGGARRGARGAARGGLSFYAECRALWQQRCFAPWLSQTVCMQDVNLVSFYGFSYSELVSCV